MSKKIVLKRVGNGNSSVVQTNEFVMLIDMNSTDEVTAYDLLKPYFRKKKGKDCVDVIMITHMDRDHCGGFKTFKEKIDSGDLIVGTILYQNYNKLKSGKDEDKDPSDDYKALQEEIDRRKEIDSPEFGEFEHVVAAGDNEVSAIGDIDYPDDLELRFISPIDGDDESNDCSCNDLSLICNLNLDNLGWILFTGDSSSKYWQERTIPDYLDNGNNGDCIAKYLVVSHHGSHTFFGNSREEVRDADPEPDNYEALDRIKPYELIISANDRFPLKDKSGDNPPHYAAYKWYKRWFVDNRNISETVDHPKEFHYTCDGDITLIYGNEEWEIKQSDEESNVEAAKKIGEMHKKGAVSVGTMTALSRPYHGYENI